MSKKHNWTTEEDELIAKMLEDKASYLAISMRVGVSDRSVGSRIAYLREIEFLPPPSRARPPPRARRKDITSKSDPNYDPRKETPPTSWGWPMLWSGEPRGRPPGKKKATVHEEDAW